MATSMKVNGKRIRERDREFIPIFKYSYSEQNMVLIIKEAYYTYYFFDVLLPNLCHHIPADAVGKVVELFWVLSQCPPY